MQGKKIAGELPNYVYEHMICDAYKMSPEEVRKMDYYDFQAHLRCILAHDRVEKEFQMNISGIETDKSKSRSQKIPDDIKKHMEQNPV